MTTLTWTKAESLEKPRIIDTTLSKTAVYIRKNIQILETENPDGDPVTKYEYDEAIITPELYKELGNNGAKVLYEIALDTPVEYPANGHVYKPSYKDDYKREMDDIKTPLELIKLAGGDISAIIPNLLEKKVNVYDATLKAENYVAMNVLELAKLYYFLYFKKEELYNEYRTLLNEYLL